MNIVDRMVTTQVIRQAQGDRAADLGQAQTPAGIPLRPQQAGERNAAGAAPPPPLPSQAQWKGTNVAIPETLSRSMAEPKNPKNDWITELRADFQRRKKATDAYASTQKQFEAERAAGSVRPSVSSIEEIARRPALSEE